MHNPVPILFLLSFLRILVLINGSRVQHLLLTGQTTLFQVSAKTSFTCGLITGDEQGALTGTKVLTGSFVLTPGEGIFFRVEKIYRNNVKTQCPKNTFRL